ncbi:MAG: CRISPR-associated helicase Cas3' [archaeon]|nr:CRISPR-associated helicase Cas3' [archaeon]
MSSYSNLHSHPTKKLENHLFNVANFSKTIFEELCIKNKVLYSNLSFLIGIAHDFAKSTTFFQAKLFHDVKTEKANHSFLSAVFGYYVVKNHLENNDDLDYYPSMVYLIILKHHGNLSSLDKELNKIYKYNKIAKVQIEDIKKNLENNSLKKFYNQYNISLDDFLGNYDDILRDLKDDLDELRFEEDLFIYLNIIILYSVLLDADKMDASETKLPNRVELPKDIVSKFKFVNFRDHHQEINKIREEAYLEVVNNINNSDLNHKIYSIDLPTGSGKTLTAFSTALNLRDKVKNELNFTPRIIYCLPFLSVIDQTEKIFSDILELSGKTGNNIMLKHDYLSDMNYKVNEDNEEPYPIANARLLIEGWNSEIIITTFIQFFYSLISNKNRALKKFHNMTNSIIILDEVQSIPYNYWKLINLMLKNLAYEFNSWIILMTATQPLIFTNDEIIPLVTNKKYYYDNFNRMNYQFDLNDVNIDIFKENIVKDIEINNDKSFMFVLNTVNSSKEVYEFIKAYFIENGHELVIDSEKGIVYVDDDIQLVYLSTNIIPHYRLKRMKQIKESNKRSIIVSTQLVEAGVDISVDIIYRDFAPMDSIIQTAGRCNRNDTRDKGLVNVVSLINDKNKRFSSFVYDAILLDATRYVLQGKTLITEKEFNIFASDEYYKYLANYGSTEDSRDLIKIIERLNLNEIPHNFKLINNDVEKIDVFIEVNEEASKIWDEFERISSNPNIFERKNEFLSIKSHFYEYIVSVNIKKLGTTVLEKEWLGHIDVNDISRKYDIEIGFKTPDEESVFFI